MSDFTITSVRNARVRAAVKLRRGKYRRQTCRTIIDGTRELQRAIAGGVQIAELFYYGPMCQAADRQDLLARLEASDTAVFEVNEQVFNQLAFGDRSEGMVAVARMPRPALSDIQLPREPLVAVLETVEKPGNFGAVLRSADGADVSAVIAAGGPSDIFNPNTIRASLGTVFTVPVCAAGVQETMAWLRDNDLTIYATRVDGELDYTQVDLTKPSAIVLGAESRGLSDVWRTADVNAVRIPMHGVGDSLNVSAAAAVFFYEALRQRRNLAAQ